MLHVEFKMLTPFHNFFCENWGDLSVDFALNLSIPFAAHNVFVRFYFQLYSEAQTQIQLTQCLFMDTDGCLFG